MKRAPDTLDRKGAHRIAALPQPGSSNALCKARNRLILVSDLTNIDAALARMPFS